MSQNTTTKLQKAHGNRDESSKRETDIPTRPMISNVEDLIEAEEFSRFEQKRREA
jgi:hypothetical protein